MNIRSISTLGLLSCLSLLLIGCGQKTEFFKVPANEVSLVGEVSDVETVFVATTRKFGGASANLVAGNDLNGFGYERADGLSYIRYEVSIPKFAKPRSHVFDYDGNHNLKPELPHRRKSQAATAAGAKAQDIAIPKGKEIRPIGQVTSPRSQWLADVSVDYLILEDRQYETQKQFFGDIKTALQRVKQKSGESEIVLFIHGYNNSLADSVFRAAQMNFEIAGEDTVAVHYAWPSRGALSGYVYDRDSTLYARTDLVQLIIELEKVGAQRVRLVGHSMGGALLMEALRQLSLTGRDDVIRRIGGVMLISPDIAVDVFNSQLRDMRTIPQGFLIFGNSYDAALSVSSILSRESDRVGNMTEAAFTQQVRRAGINYFDTEDPSGSHNTVAYDVQTKELVENLLAFDRSYLRNEQRGTSALDILPKVLQTVAGVSVEVVDAIQEGGDQRKKSDAAGAVVYWPPHTD